MGEQKISMTASGLDVPDEPVIPFIEGDGIGPDVWRASKRVLDAAVAIAYRGKRSLRWKEVLAGEKAFNRVGEWLPKATVDAFREYLVSIKGPLTTPVGGGIRSLNVALRQELDLYANVRPVRWFHGAPSPLRHPEQVDMVIFRENTEDIYAGIEYMYDTPEAARLLHFLTEELGVRNIRFPETSSLGIKPVSKEGSERLIRAAIQYAVTHQKPSVTLVHKGNIMKFTEGAFRTWGYELAEREFADQVYTWRQWEAVKADEGEEAAQKQLQIAMAHNRIIIKDAIADNFLQQILLAPQEHSVVATLNLNGDYISDALAAAVGGIGIAPGANINYTTGYAVFEATHGTAPRFAGTDSMNPSSLILSGMMMLEYMGWKEAAALIVKGIGTTLMRKTMTIDFYKQTEGARLVKCSEFGEEVVKNMEP